MNHRNSSRRRNETSIQISWHKMEMMKNSAKKGRNIMIIIRETTYADDDVSVSNFHSKYIYMNGFQDFVIICVFNFPIS